MISNDKTTTFPADEAQSPSNPLILVRRLRGIVLLVDSISLVLGTLLYGWERGIDLGYLVLTLFLLTGILITFQHWRLYRFELLSAFPQGLGHILSAIVGNLFLVTGALAALGFDFTLSQYWLGICVTVSFTLIYLTRWIVAQLITSWFCSGRLVCNVAVVGAGGRGQRLISDAQKRETDSHHLIGIFDERKTRIDGTERTIGNIDTLVDYTRRGLIQHIVIALPWRAEQRILDLVTKLIELPVEVSLSSDLVACRFRGIYRHVPGIGTTLRVGSVPSSGLRGSIKWMEDKILAMLLVSLLVPVFVVIIVAIKLDSPGPILFRQKRFGFNRQPITVFKFRTMYDSKHSGCFVQATLNDTRITRVGGVLRRTSLDELPQLFNVLKGDMSLVGPRPHPIQLDEQFSNTLPGYNARFRVKPGITGWAQVNGWRGETDTVEKMRARIEHDLFYIEEWSLWFDFRILMLTVIKGWTHRNAY